MLDRWPSRLSRSGVRRRRCSSTLLVAARRFARRGLPPRWQPRRRRPPRGSGSCRARSTISVAAARLRGRRLRNAGRGPSPSCTPLGRKVRSVYLDIGCLGELTGRDRRRLPARWSLGERRTSATLDERWLDIAPDRPRWRRDPAASASSSLPAQGLRRGRARQHRRLRKQDRRSRSTPPTSCASTAGSPAKSHRAWHGGGAEERPRAGAPSCSAPLRLRRRRGVLRLRRVRGASAPSSPPARRSSRPSTRAIPPSFCRGGAARLQHDQQRATTFFGEPWRPCARSPRESRRKRASSKPR